MSHSPICGLSGDKRNLAIPSVERAVLGIHGWGFGRPRGSPAAKERMAEEVCYGEL